MKKVVVITGGSSGIGKSLAEIFLKKDYSVVISAKNKEELENTAKEIGAASIIADTRSEVEVKNLANKTIEQFGHIDIWINNTGVMRKFPDNEPIDMDKAHEMFNTNIFGYIFGCRIAAQKMKNQKGVIVNVLSSAALDATRGDDVALYATTKWAIRGFTEAFRGKNKDTGITVIATYPGGTKTNLYQDYIPKNFEQYMEPKDVAEKIVANIEQENPELEQVLKRPTT